MGVSKNRGKTPKMDGLWWKILLKLMIWAYHYFWKHPVPSLQVKAPENSWVPTAASDFWGQTILAYFQAGPLSFIHKIQRLTPFDGSPVWVIRVAQSQNLRMKWQFVYRNITLSRHFIENRGFVCLHPWYDFEWQNHAQNVGWFQKHTRWVNVGDVNSCLIYLKLGACMCTSTVSYNKNIMIVSIELASRRHVFFGFPKHFPHERVGSPYNPVDMRS